MESKRKKELVLRITAGLIMLPLAIYGIIYAHSHLFFCVVWILSLLATYEFIKMVNKSDRFVFPKLIWLSSILLPFSMFFGWEYFISAFFMLLFISFLLKMFSNNPTDNVLEDVSYCLISMLFIPFLFTFISLIHMVSYQWVLFLCFIIWASDTFAYFTGISIGKTKLIPKVSPGKTVEGIIGGFIGAIIVACIMNHYIIHGNWILVLIGAILLIIVGIIGDLIESMLKRSSNIKDSGALIPGHGGILDRFDSLIIGAPILYFYLQYSGLN